MTAPIQLVGHVGITTVATRIRDRAWKAPDQVAMREKYLGVWRDITWGEYWERVETVGHALIALGLEPGDRVAVHSENRPEWLVVDSACIAARLACMGLYPTNPAPEVEYLLSNGGARVLIAEDQEQVDKVLAVDDTLPDLEKIVYIEPRGVATYDDHRLISWDEFLALGRAHREANPRMLDERMESARPWDIVYLVYTSGTTGPPKGAMLTNANVDFAIQTLAGEGAGIVDPPPGEHDLLVSYLPLCHVYEKIFGQWFNSGAGAVVHFGESLDTLAADLRDVQPTILQGVPRIWERIHGGVFVRMASASRLKRVNNAVWMRAAQRIGRTLANRQGKHSIGSSLLYALGYLFLFRSLKDRLGLRRLRYGVSAAAPIAPEVLQFFMGIGVPVFEAYGMTENAGVATRTRPGRVRLGTVGEAYEQIELRLDEDTGEILTRHPAVFVGYWGMEEATREAIDPEGWLHTGDVGEWVGDTHLRIIDRLRDLIITSGGKNVSPSEIENSLKTSPWIAEAIVVGDRRKYLSALIGVDFDAVSEWAQRRRIPHTTYRDLTEKEEVRTLIQEAVDQTNEKFARPEQIKKFSLLSKELDHEEGELTATRKVKRTAIATKFGEEIEALYR